MAIRKYQKAHLCKHIYSTGNVLVFVKESCPVRAQRNKEINNWKPDWVDKKDCRECEYFEQKESEGEKG